MGPFRILIYARIKVLGIFASGILHFWFPNLSFCMLGAFTSASWVSVALSSGTWEHKKVLILSELRDLILVGFQVSWIVTGHIFSCLFPGFFSDDFEV